MLDWLLDTLGCGATRDADEGSRREAPPSVMINKRFISAQEQRLFHTLQRHYGPTGHVLAEVALNRLLWFPNSADRSKLQRWRNKVAQKSVDFLIVDPKSLRPIVAIELDDKSHLTEKRERRDDVVNALCVAAGLRLVRVPGGVTVEELRAILDARG
jgi:very-short-patch-repair endonuclease